MRSSGSIARRRPHRPARRTLLNLGVVRVGMRGAVSSSYIDIPIKKPSQMLVMRREIVLRRISGGLRTVLCDRDRGGSQCCQSKRNSQRTVLEKACAFTGRVIAAPNSKRAQAQAKTAASGVTPSTVWYRFYV